LNTRSFEPVQKVSTYFFTAAGAGAAGAAAGAVGTVIAAGATAGHTGHGFLQSMAPMQMPISKSTTHFAISMAIGLFMVFPLYDCGPSRGG
jgi:hypothetical protein